MTRPTDHHRVDCGEVTVAVTEWGAIGAERPPVVLLHGFTGDASTMAGMAAAMPQRRVLAPDLLGHGATDSPPGPTLYTMDSCVRLLLSVLAEFGIAQFDLVGYSMGARVGLSLAAASPETVRNLVLIGGSPGLASEAERVARRRTDAELADSLEKDGLAGFVDRWMAQPLFASQKRLGAAALSAARAQRLRNNPSGLAECLRGMGTGSMPPLFDALEMLSVPTWWVHGAEDEKFGQIAADAAAIMPVARVVSVADAGHAAHLENPQQTAAILLTACNPPRFPL